MILRSEENKKDLVEIFSDFGKGVKNAFKSTEKNLPTENDGFSFGVVYANDLAKAEIEKAKPVFPSAQSSSAKNVPKPKMKPRKLRLQWSNAKKVLAEKQTIGNFSPSTARI